MTTSQVGRLGDKVRSDLHVAFETSDGGGLTIELDSKVAPYYGDNIRTQIERIAGAHGVKNGKLKVTDRGALPFVIGARVETAMRRAGVAARTPEPDSVLVGRTPTTRDRLRRSRLYLPGNEPKFMVNAALHGGDGIILDLEDSVHADEKDAARVLVREALRTLDFSETERMVRINQLPAGLEDLDEIVPVCPDLVLVPKVESAEQMVAVDERITQIQKRLGIDRPLWLMPILESALGVENAFEIVQASKRTVALTIGLEDYTADLGVVKTVGGNESLYARTRLVNAAKAAGCQAIDSVFGDVGDMDGLRSWGERSRALGFEGMGCIHPRQIPVIHEAFAPSQVEIDKAAKIVGAFERAQKAGLGVVSLGSKMVDPPVVNRALKLVALAKAMGLLEEKAG